MGIFITFEGCDGAGKTTQAKLLATKIGQTREVLSLYEPGGTSLGELVHSYVRSHGSGEISEATVGQARFDGMKDFDARVDPIAELFLFAASRAQLVSERIRPALEQGNVVICDRFADSTAAYQGYGRELSIEQVDKMNDVATGGLKPDLTILLDILPEDGLARVPEKKDRMEKQAQDFHRRVRDGYLTIAEQDPDRFLTLDATQPAEEVQAQIWSRVEKLLHPEAAQRLL
ncbi:MAG: dTMP kinase [Dehalococcoidia bacterium]|nr:dTMP kinase [Dehalococcoidia bacterium]